MAAIGGPSVGELAARRRELSSTLGPEPYVALFDSGELKRRSADVDYRFRPDSTFYYLTGLRAPAARLLLIGGGEREASCMLFVERHEPAREAWVGRRPSIDEVELSSGIECVRYTDEFEGHLMRALRGARLFYHSVECPSAGMCLPAGQQLAAEVHKRAPHVERRDASEAVGGLRRVKSSYEVQCMVRAAQVTCEGLAEAMSEARPGIAEWQVEATLSYGFASRGCREQGFPPIIAGGPNATTLHYEDNASVLTDGQMVLMDVGAEFEMYSGDVSRTVPTSGTYEGRSRELYQGVLYIQKDVIQKVRPGVSLSELNQYAAERMGGVLSSVGLVSDSRDLASIRRYYMHGIGHYLGLDAHDPGSPQAPLVPGVVLTVEPGVYVKDERIGIRIEDDVLVTESGCKVLTSALPKELDEVESLLRR